MRKYIWLTGIFSLLELSCTETLDPLLIFEELPPGLAADPPLLSFPCTAPLCGSITTSTISVVGNRSMALVRVLLSDRNHPDFSLELPQEPPVIVGPGQTYPIKVRYLGSSHPTLSDPVLKISYVDASPVETDPDRVEPGELEIPIVRRRIGEADLGIRPQELSFGVVPVGEHQEVVLELEHVGFGNVPLTLASIEPIPSGTVQIDSKPLTLLPEEKSTLSATWSPSTEMYLSGSIEVLTAGETLPHRIPFHGTSIAGPVLGVEPTVLDLGEIEVGRQIEGIVTLSNQGGSALSIEYARLEGLSDRAQGELRWSSGEAPTILPLSTSQLAVSLNAVAAGTLFANLVIESNDRAQKSLSIPVTALLSRPQLVLRPTQVDFGPVPRGWRKRQTIEIENAGYGSLDIHSIGFEVGSIRLFHLDRIPQLPRSLLHGQRISFDVGFEALSEAAFSASLAIQSSDPENLWTTLAVQARVTSCNEGCPIANGTADCSTGSCAVGSCLEGYFDADREAANGCECSEPSTLSDTGSTCSGESHRANLGEGATTTFAGIVPTTDDVDFFRVHAADEFDLLQENFDLRVLLSSSDPNIELCVYRFKTDSPNAACFLQEERCGRSLRWEGDYLSNDSSDLAIRVRRKPGSKPNCVPYSVFVRNG